MSSEPGQGHGHHSPRSEGSAGVKGGRDKAAAAAN